MISSLFRSPTLFNTCANFRQNVSKTSRSITNSILHPITQLKITRLNKEILKIERNFAAKNPLRRLVTLIFKVFQTRFLQGKIAQLEKERSQINLTLMHKVKSVAKNPSFIACIGAIFISKILLAPSLVNVPAPLSIPVDVVQIGAQLIADKFVSLGSIALSCFGIYHVSTSSFFLSRPTPSQNTLPTSASLSADLTELLNNGDSSRGHTPVPLGSNVVTTEPNPPITSVSPQMEIKPYDVSNLMTDLAVLKWDNY